MRFPPTFPCNIVYLLQYIACSQYNRLRYKVCLYRMHISSWGTCSVSFFQSTQDPVVPVNPNKPDTNVVLTVFRLFLYFLPSFKYLTGLFALLPRNSSSGACKLQRKCLDLCCADLYNILYSPTRKWDFKGNKANIVVRIGQRLANCSISHESHLDQ